MAEKHRGRLMIRVETPENLFDRAAAPSMLGPCERQVSPAGPDPGTQR
jgi:hypothetical protein